MIGGGGCGLLPFFVIPANAGIHGRARLAVDPLPMFRFHGSRRPPG